MTWGFDGEGASPLSGASFTPASSGVQKPLVVVRKERGHLPLNPEPALVKTRPPPVEKAGVLLEFLVPDPELLLVLRLRGHELRTKEQRAP